MLKTATVESSQPHRAEVDAQASTQVGTQDPAQNKPADAAPLAESVACAIPNNFTAKDDDLDFAESNTNVMPFRDAG